MVCKGRLPFEFATDLPDGTVGIVCRWLSGGEGTLVVCWLLGVLISTSDESSGEDIISMVTVWSGLHNATLFLLPACYLGLFVNRGEEYECA